MPRKISPEERSYVSLMITEKDVTGEFIYGQREIEKITNLSRPFIRKLAENAGRQFDRNGIEIKGQICVCANCGNFFRRPRSKIDRAKQNFCDEVCKAAFMRGPEHPSWRTGKSANSFSKWIQGQAEYKKFKEICLERAEHKCEITGTTDNLNVHHINPKAENISPEKACDPDNGIVISEEVHRRIHSLIREGNGYEESIEIVRKEHNERRT